MPPFCGLCNPQEPQNLRLSESLRVVVLKLEEWDVIPGRAYEQPCKLRVGTGGFDLVRSRSMHAAEVATSGTTVVSGHCVHLPNRFPSSRRTTSSCYSYHLHSSSIHGLRPNDLLHSFQQHPIAPVACPDTCKTSSPNLSIALAFALTPACEARSFPASLPPIPRRGQRPRVRVS